MPKKIAPLNGVQVRDARPQSKPSNSLLKNSRWRRCGEKSLTLMYAKYSSALAFSCALPACFLNRLLSWRMTGPDRTEAGVVLQALVERAEVILGLPGGSF